MGKLTQYNLYPIASTGLGVVAVGTAFDLETYNSGEYAKAQAVRLGIDFAQTTTTAPASGTLIRIQGRGTSIEQWRDLLAITSGTTAALATTSSASAAAGATTMAMVASGLFGARSTTLYVNDGTIANSEWIDITSQTTTTLNLSSGLLYAHASGSGVFSQAFQWYPVIDVRCIGQMRAIVDNNRQATGPSVVCRVQIRGWK